MMFLSDAVTELSGVGLDRWSDGSVGFCGIVHGKLDLRGDESCRRVADGKTYRISYGWCEWSSSMSDS